MIRVDIQRWGCKPPGSEDPECSELSLERSLVIQYSRCQGKPMCWVSAHGHDCGTVDDTGQRIHDMVPSMNHGFDETCRSTWIMNQERHHLRVTIVSFIISPEQILKRIMTVNLFPLKSYLS